MIVKGEWLERGAAWALTLALTAAGLQIFTAYGRDQRRGRVYDRTLVDFIRPETAPDEYLNSRQLRFVNSRVLVEGLGGPEADSQGGHYRHGLGPVTRLTLVAGFAGGELSFLFNNGVEGQDLTVRLNDEVLEALHSLPAGKISRSYPLKFRPEQSNVVGIEYGRYNHHGVSLAEQDPRNIAGTFTQLTLRWQ